MSNTTEEKAEAYRILEETVATFPENELFGTVEIEERSKSGLWKAGIGRMMNTNPFSFDVFTLRHMGTGQWQPLYLRPTKKEFPLSLPLREDPTLSNKNWKKIVGTLKEQGFCESPRFLRFNRTSFLSKTKQTEYERFPQSPLIAAAERRAMKHDPRFSYSSIMEAKDSEIFPLEYRELQRFASKADREFDAFVKKTALPVATLYGVEMFVYHPQLLGK